MNATYKYFFTTNRLIVPPGPSSAHARIIRSINTAMGTTTGNRESTIIAIIIASPIDSPIVCQARRFVAPIDRRLSAAQGLARLRAK
jgi:hypothetical protein